MIFNYELRFSGVYMDESLLVGRNFLSGICKLKPKRTKNLILFIKT